MNKINILVPDLPESVNDGVIAVWHKKIGEKIYYNENIVDIETDKVMLEISSPCDGILNNIFKNSGETVKSNEILGDLVKLNIKKEISNDIKSSFKKKADGITLPCDKKSDFFSENKNVNFKKNINNFTPSMRRLIRLKNINENLIKFDKSNFIVHEKEIIKDDKKNKFREQNNENIQKRVKMTQLRQKISERLLETKNNTAMLTTFNEVNMQSIMFLRKKYSKSFEKKYKIRLGFMSFFVKAVVEALKNFPEINASIDQKDIIYYKNFDISIAVSTPRGLITPVLRNADNMSMVEIEKKIKEFSIKGAENKIQLKELIGGNFTITNGGVFGSLMSTPIINPPQTAILAMHAIKDRPMAIDGEVKIMPMMYLSLSYDHRLIDGKESVSFLVMIKNILEDFNRILISV
ncbi:dihydrolipoamide succinyltransferase [Buchnera aphidicola (Melanaphis sacchari)]|uniref:Dihydrolipoyllysine-residue succinyltransferase n=1 Tax=Buchnera aphidicola (Melanaphis sacchari) TaxID=2173854 RepID=A0A2U8DG79_9GAMM|nr:dihydrolipoyllysine-residue succinyltransferase [Buchnera aphidicola]AWH90485.1 dihydrolipoamide succinyltransferase [Buchnera aphidicola (Melanaphis sacchari)]